MQKYSSKKGTTTEEFGLRANIGKNRGITSIRDNDGDKDLERGSREMNIERAERGRWNNSVSRLTAVSSDEDGQDREDLKS
jgi:hypothetical protein